MTVQIAITLGLLTMAIILVILMLLAIILIDHVERP